MNRRTFIKLTSISGIGITLFPNCAETNSNSPFQTNQTLAFIGDSITYGGDYINFLDLYFTVNHPQLNLHFINLGLSSETVSGLSEKDHPFPRPVIFDRLDQILDYVRPDIASFWYGVNCGIYNPFSESRFQAYQQGIEKLIDTAVSRNIAPILLTPAPLAMPEAEKEKLRALNDTNYMYSNPYPEYNEEVLSRYREFINEWEHPKLKAKVDAFQILMKGAQQAYNQDFIHPNRTGHWMIADGFLKALGFEEGLKNISPNLSETQKPLFELIRKKNEIYRDALVFNLGALNYWKKDYLSLEEAEQKVADLRKEIREMAAAQ